MARIPEICTFNNIAQRLKSGLRSSLKVRLRCAYHPRYQTCRIFCFSYYYYIDPFERNMGPLVIEHTNSGPWIVLVRLDLIPPTRCRVRIAYLLFVPLELELGCVLPLLEVALRQTPPLLSISRFSRPYYFPLPLLDVIVPSSSRSFSGHLSVSDLPLSTSYCPSVVFQACHMSSPLPFCFSGNFQDIIYFSSFPDSVYLF